MAGMVTCANVPILSIPNFNVYQQSRMTVDTRFGEYNECNPDPSSGIFKCATRDHQAAVQSIQGHSRLLPQWGSGVRAEGQHCGVLRPCHRTKSELVAVLRREHQL
jgi:hypothetical protein